jgi:large subunit ribosomal protein L23
MKVIIKPVVTEKQTAHAEKLNRYGFIVAKTANKLEIKKAVEELYNVTVLTVNTLRTPGKNKSRITKAGVVEGRVHSTKKAMVTLVDGDKIDYYSNI